MPAAQIGVTRFNSSPFLVQVSIKAHTGEAKEYDSSSWDSTTHTGNGDGVPGSWQGHCPTLAVVDV